MESRQIPLIVFGLALIAFTEQFPPFERNLRSRSAEKPVALGVSISFSVVFRTSVLEHLNHCTHRRFLFLEVG